MSAPDASEYVDLSEDDLTAQEVFDTGLTHLTATFADYIPAETNVEATLGEGLGLQVAEMIFSINRMPNDVLQALFLNYGVVRDAGTLPEFMVEWSMSNTLGVTIPAGTQAIYDIGDGNDPMVFELLANLVITPGYTTNQGIMRGSRADSTYNNITATLTPLTSIAGLALVQVISATTPGVDPETDASYFERVTLRLARLSEALVLPDHFAMYALGYARPDTGERTVVRADAVDKYRHGISSNLTGWLTVYIYDTADVPYFGEGLVSAELQAEMLDLCVPGLTVEVWNASLQFIGVNVSVVALDSYSLSDVGAAVVTALQETLSPLHWPWAKVIRITDLMALVESVPGVDRLQNDGALLIRRNLLSYSLGTMVTSASWFSTNSTRTFTTSYNHSGPSGGENPSGLPGEGQSLRVAATGGGNVVVTNNANMVVDFDFVGDNIPAFPDNMIGSVFVLIPTGATVRNAVLNIAFRTSADAAISNVNGTSTPLVPGAWTEVRVSATCPASANRVEITLTISTSPAAGEVFMIDDWCIYHEELSDYNPIMVATGLGRGFLPTPGIMSVAVV